MNPNIGESSQVPYVASRVVYEEYNSEKVNIDVKEFEPFIKDKKNLYNVIATEGNIHPIHSFHSLRIDVSPSYTGMQGRIHERYAQWEKEGKCLSKMIVVL